MKKTSKLSACLSDFLKFAALHQKLFILGALTLAILFPFLITDRYVMRLAVVGFMYVMLSLGLNLVTGYMGQMSFGHAAFWGIGAYTAALLTKNLAWAPCLPFWPRPSWWVSSASCWVFRC